MSLAGTDPDRMVPPRERQAAARRVGHLLPTPQRGKSPVAPPRQPCRDLSRLVNLDCAIVECCRGNQPTGAASGGRHNSDRCKEKTPKPDVPSVHRACE
jgi:hypothetical protein